MQHPWVYAHVNMGWVLFAVGLVLLFLAGSLIQRMPPFVRFPTVMTEQPSSLLGTRAGTMAIAAIVSAGLLTAAPAGAGWLQSRAAATSVHGSPPPLPLMAGWEGPLASPSTWQPRFPTADTEGSAVYRSNEDAVYLYFAWYAHERGDAKLFFFANRLFNSREWLAVNETIRIVNFDEAAFAVREQVLRVPDGDRIRVLWSCYQVNEQWTVSALRAKLQGLWGVFAGRPSALVVAFAADDESDEAARSLLKRYLAAAGAMCVRG
jgi:EpsI family protein